MTVRHTFHLIANAHLDPVWLWDWREGLNEGIITSRTMLDLMDEFPEFTFVRGEAAIYRHIEAHDPETFARMQRRIAEGRWDVVGGTHVQPDTNLTGTETFCRHFARSQAYFRSRFGRAPEVAWAADSFGHSGGLPDILAAAGMTGFAFTRPSAGIVPIPLPLFWWEGTGGGRVLAYRPAVGWYGTEREDMPRRLDALLAGAERHGLHHVGVFYGLGNHGGGPTRRMLREIAEWAGRHPDVAVVHSGLHGLFRALRQEMAARAGTLDVPVHRGELNFCLRGCYVSVAKLKTAFRAAEAAVMRAEAAESAVSAALALPPVGLGAAWDALLLNSFHDILPGSLIERACDEQLAWLGAARHDALVTENRALNALSRRVDTRRAREPEGDRPGSAVLLAWNPHPWEYRGPIELEASLDYRPIWEYRGRAGDLPVAVLDANGNPLPHQVVETEHSAMPQLPWRKRVVTQVSLPPMGWSILEMAWDERVPAPSRDDSLTAARQDGSHAIENGIYRIEAVPGGAGVKLWRGGREVFKGNGLGVVTVEDPWGSWGGMGEEPASLDLSDVRDVWSVQSSDVLESGPERAVLAVLLTGGSSRLELRFALYDGRPAVEVAARLFLNERSARVKLCLPVDGRSATFEVPGGQVDRAPAGEVPGGRWVRVQTGRQRFGFASDALYGYDLKDGVLRVSLARASRYANDVPTPPDADPWRPVVDCGELKFRFLLTTGAEAGDVLPVLSRELEMPVATACVPPKPGMLPRSGSLLELPVANLQLLALKPAEDGDGWILRVQETAGRCVRRSFVRWCGEIVDLDAEIPPYGLASWRLRYAAGDGAPGEPCRAAWRATAVNTAET